MARVLLKNLFALWQPRPFNLKTTKKKIQNFSFKFNSRLTFLTVCLIAQLLYAEAHTITCESIGSCSTSDDHNDVCCIMTQKTKIPGSSYTIVNPKNGTVQALDFNNNRNIDFLPVLVISVFPNIVEYDARNCSIKSISKENFERLHHLKLVYLQGNQIETVRGDVFDGLNKIEDIDLASNKIARLNGQFFDGLPLLVYVNLNNNVCVSEHFLTKERIGLLPGIIQEKCSFDESKREIPVTIPPIKNSLKLKYVRRDEFFRY